MAKRIGSGQKIRPVGPPHPKLLKLVLEGMSKGILKYTKRTREHFKEMHMESTMWGNVPNDHWVNNIIRKLKEDVTSLYYHDCINNNSIFRHDNSTGIEEHIIEDMLIHLQCHTALVSKT